MTARSHNRGSEIEYNGNRWVDCKTGFAISNSDPCVLCGKACGDSGIDPCIAPLIKALNDAGVETIASCGGHGRRPGNIGLADGRELIVVRDYETARLLDQFFDG